MASIYDTLCAAGGTSIICSKYSEILTTGEDRAAVLQPNLFNRKGREDRQQRKEHRGRTEKRDQTYMIIEIYNLRMSSTVLRGAPDSLQDRGMNPFHYPQLFGVESCILYPDVNTAGGKIFSV